LATLTTKAIELKNKIKNQSNIGLVPTMGNLHEGHLNLVRESLSQHPITVVTIFVNPTQFGKNEDLSSYPRTLDEDIEKLRQLDLKNSEIIVFSPKDEKEIYPSAPLINFSISSLENKLCDLNRPGHFNGVMQVIYRLFKLISPNSAYFGEKDYQQLMIIKTFSHELFPEIEIKAVPIKREASGLAMSSRNNYLNDDEKVDALILKNTLNSLKQNYFSSNESSVNLIKEQIDKTISKDDRWQYLDLLDADNLLAPSAKTTKLIIAGAYKINNVRLIDNTVFNI
tara:strand:+ start:1150 stop:1998 length:849 start_codon:yes stop_codon:yes gene_type:complete